MLVWSLNFKHLQIRAQFSWCVFFSAAKTTTKAPVAAYCAVLRTNIHTVCHRFFILKVHYTILTIRIRWIRANRTKSYFFRLFNPSRPKLVSKTTRAELILLLIARLPSASQASRKKSFVVILSSLSSLYSNILGKGAPSPPHRWEASTILLYHRSHHHHHHSQQVHHKISAKASASLCALLVWSKSVLVLVCVF